MPERGHPDPCRVEATVLMHYVNDQGELHTMRIHCSENPDLAPWLQPSELRETARLIASRVGAECEILSLQLKHRSYSPLAGGVARNDERLSGTVLPFRARSAAGERNPRLSLAIKACLFAAVLFLEGASSGLAPGFIYG